MFDTILSFIQLVCLLVAIGAFIYGVYLLGKLSGRLEMINKDLKRDFAKLDKAMKESK